ncbi:hypothetical protein BSPWISOXPB_9266 [uncultured Gammaproteobacteria bacterium]|nr:hypothetical protein BSPWISOXPB_9266 [uncultured Gammaproteobacteria bacterium]
MDTTQYTLSSYGALELSNKGSIEAVLGVAKATHKSATTHQVPTKAAMAFLPVLLTVQIYRLRALIYRLSFATTSAVSR